MHCPVTWELTDQKPVSPDDHHICLAPAPHRIHRCGCGATLDPNDPPIGSSPTGGP